MPIGKQIFDISSICEYLLVEICLDPFKTKKTCITSFTCEYNYIKNRDYNSTVFTV